QEHRGHGQQGACEGPDQTGSGHGRADEKTNQKGWLVAALPPGSVRRRIEFDAETWHAIHRLSLDSMKSLQDLADGAFRDLLTKRRRPMTLKEMLRESARSQPANDHDGAR